MPTTRVNGNIVVLGAWNPAIIHPTWLFKNKVVEDLPSSVEVTLGMGPAGRNIAFELGGVAWKAAEDKMEIHGKDQAKDCGVYAARVLALLPHTPIVAVGANFIFQCPLQDWPEAVKPYLGELRLGAEDKHTNFRQMQWNGVRQQDNETRLSVAILARLDRGVQVTLNFHRNVQDIAKAQTFAGRWSQDRDVAVETLRELFKVEVA